MSVVIDGTTGITTPGISNSGTLTQTGAATMSNTLQTATTIGVGAATPSTSGAGITFPATQSASSDANTLDDYEEGSWTPIITDTSGGTTGITYSVQIGRYTKVGSLVHVQGYFQFSNKGSVSGSVKISNLPFANTSSTNAFAAPVFGVIGGITGITAYFLVGDFTPGATTFILYYPNGTGETALTFANVTNSFNSEFSFTYQTNT